MAELVRKYLQATEDYLEGIVSSSRMAELFKIFSKLIDVFKLINVILCKILLYDILELRMKSNRGNNNIL